MSKLVKATLAEQAYQELRSRIVSGRLAGGVRLLPSELAEDLGISATPVKEACARLEADGLLTVSARRGMVVRSFTLEDVRELYNARILVEKGALEHVFANGKVTDALIEDLSRSVAGHRHHAQSRSLDELTIALSYDRKFHRSLVAAAGIVMVTEWHGRILSQTHTVIDAMQGDYTPSVHEHQDVLNAMKAGAGKEAVLALESHLLRARDNTLLHARTMEPKAEDAA